MAARAGRRRPLSRSGGGSRRGLSRESSSPSRRGRRHPDAGLPGSGWALPRSGWATHPAGWGTFPSGWEPSHPDRTLPVRMGIVPSRMADSSHPGGSHHHRGVCHAQGDARLSHGDGGRSPPDSTSPLRIAGFAIRIGAVPIRDRRHRHPDRHVPPPDGRGALPGRQRVRRDPGLYPPEGSLSRSGGVSTEEASSGAKRHPGRSRTQSGRFNQGADRFDPEGERSDHGRSRRRPHPRRLKKHGRLSFGALRSCPFPPRSSPRARTGCAPGGRSPGGTGGSLPNIRGNNFKKRHRVAVT